MTQNRLFPVGTLIIGTLILGASANSNDTGSDSALSPADGNAIGDDGTVTIYTGRHYGIEPVFEQFTADTGIEVWFTTGNDPELRERLIAEGASTPA